MEEFDSIESGITLARGVIQHLLNDKTNAAEFQILFNEWNVINTVNEFEKILKKIEDKCKLIKGKIERTYIKLYFFGKMSSGKSRIINGIIRKDLFLSGPENTTSCFVHIEKSEDTNYKIIHEDKEVGRFDDVVKAQEEIDKLSTYNKEKKNVSFDEARVEINELSKNIEENDSKTDKFIKVFVPIDEENKIMKENIELVDSPGSGYNEKITKYIKEYAKDADIFVFVLMHDITEDDEKFFEFQSVNSTKPDIFVLINKWDDTDCNRPGNIKQSENNLLNKCDQLIMKMSENSAKNIRDRTYFISANEIFDIRINNNKEYLNNQKKKLRYENFEKFETKLSEYVQNPKIHKYHRYSQELKSIKKELSIEFQKFCRNILNTLSSYSIKTINEKNKKCRKHIKEIRKKCRETKKNCIAKIKCKVTKMLNTIKIDDSNIIKDNIKKHYLSIDKDINKLSTDIGEKLSFIKEIYVTENNLDNEGSYNNDGNDDDYNDDADDDDDNGNDDNNDDDDDNEKNDDKNDDDEKNDDKNDDNDNDNKSKTEIENSSVSSLGKKDFQIQTDMEVITYPKSKIAVRFLSIIPVVGAIATNILLNRIDNADEHHLKRTSFKVLNKEIHAQDKERIEEVKAVIDEIEENSINEMNKIVEKIKTEKECAVFLLDLFCKPDSIVNILFNDF